MMSDWWKQSVALKPRALGLVLIPSLSAHPVYRRSCTHRNVVHVQLLGGREEAEIKAGWRHKKDKENYLT